MSKAREPDEDDVIRHIQTGAELRAWRTALGLRSLEIAELIGVTERTINRAERSAEPSARVLRGIHALEERFLAGKLDITPILRRRFTRPRKKTDK